MSRGRTLAAGQSCRIRIMDVGTREIRTVHESETVLYEAPNWTRDDRLIVNAGGLLWSLPADGSSPPAQIELVGVPELNNDHVLAPDHVTIYVSANDWHIYEASLEGGGVRRITADDGRMHFLHGISPDGGTLAYVALEPDGDDWLAAAHVRTVGVDGTGDEGLTGGIGVDDGPEFSPDGEWVYFNTERFSVVPGHSQIARIRTDGIGIEQLTSDHRVNWFPHFAPTGDAAVYLSYAPGVVGHPADQHVELRLVRDGRWRDACVIAELFGGQGTINVNSWSPDGERLAFVDYPLQR